MSDLTDKMIAAGWDGFSDEIGESGVHTTAVKVALAAALRVLDDTGFTVITHGTGQLALSLPKMADEIEAAS